MSESKPGRNSDGSRSGTDRVQILLHEYDSLRAEIIHRTGNMYQLWAMVIIVVGWVATRGRISGLWWIFLGIILVVLLAAAIYLYSQIHRDIKKAATRLAEIEAQVDHDTGDWYLLRWERLWGGSRTGFFGRARPLDVPDRPE